MTPGMFVPVSVIRDESMTPAEKITLLAIAALVADGRPRVLEARFIARDGNLSAGAVQRAVRVLQARDFVLVTRRPAEPNTYAMGPAWTSGVPSR